MSDFPSALHDQVRAWVEETYGSAFESRNLETLNGHAGLTFAFEVLGPDQIVIDALVLRLAPIGVRLKGPADVLRQVVPLRLLHRADFPVPELRFWGDDPKWFGTPYLISHREGGYAVGLEEGISPSREDFLEAARTLGRLHRSVNMAEIQGWQAPRDWVQEVNAWDTALDKVGDTKWRSHATEVRERLLAACSDAFNVGLCHGDYQFSNLLFDRGQVCAVLDWELAGVGPQLLDLGWFLTINDQSSWAHRVALDDRPTDAQIRHAYEEAFGSKVDDADVHFACAVAAYKFAIITGFNLYLHRTGRRIDAHWEHLEMSIPRLLSRSIERLVLMAE